MDDRINGIKHDTFLGSRTHAQDPPQPASTPRLTAALAILQTLHAQHVARLLEGGHDGKGALVNRRDYWAALHKAGIPTDMVFDLLDQSRIRTQADGLYWVPVEGQS